MANEKVNEHLRRMEALRKGKKLIAHFAERDKYLRKMMQFFFVIHVEKEL